MPESRDRLMRTVDLAAAFARRRSGILGVLVDEQEHGLNLFEPPTGQRNVGVLGAQGTIGFGRRPTIGRGNFGTPRNLDARGRNRVGTPTAGRENIPSAGSTMRGRGRSVRRSSVLLSWYPRTPLRDITTVAWAYERRSRLREDKGQQEDNTGIMGESTVGSSIPRRSAPLEHDMSLLTPSSVIAKKPCILSVGKVPKILLDNTKQTVLGDDEFLTPQKKLLNQIDEVQKVVLDELSKLKRTPTAKKAEREKRVRTLMSMR